MQELYLTELYHYIIYIFNFSLNTESYKRLQFCILNYLCNHLRQLNQTYNNLQSTLNTTKSNVFPYQHSKHKSTLYTSKLTDRYNIEIANEQIQNTSNRDHQYRQRSIIKSVSHTVFKLWTSKHSSIAFKPRSIFLEIFKEQHSEYHPNSDRFFAEIFKER